MTLMRALFERRALEDPTKPLTDESLLETLGGEMTEAGVVISEEGALRIIAVFRAVALIASVCAALPLKKYEGMDSDDRVRLGRHFLDNPHADMTEFEWREQMLAHLLLWGNVYEKRRRNNLGELRFLDAILPRRVTPRLDKAARDDRLNPRGKVFDVLADDGTTQVLTPAEILHIPGFGYDGVRGLSPIGLARQGLSINVAAERFGARFWSRGAKFPGYLSTEQKLVPGDADRARLEWRQAVHGPDNDWATPVLGQGTEYKMVGIPPEDAQFLDTRRFGISEVARLFGLPPHLLADVEKSTSWGSGIEQQNIAMIVFTYGPWLTRIEARLSRDVMGNGRFCEHDVNGLLRGDLRSRFAALGVAVGGPWMTPDEARSKDNLPRLPDDEGAHLVAKSGSGAGDAGNLNDVMDVEEAKKVAP